jgi:hypothetical protein
MEYERFNAHFYVYTGESKVETKRGKTMC